MNFHFYHFTEKLKKYLKHIIIIFTTVIYKHSWIEKSILVFECYVWFIFEISEKSSVLVHIWVRKHWIQFFICLINNK